MYTKDDVAAFRSEGGIEVRLSDAERQAICDAWNVNAASQAAAELEAQRCAEIEGVIRSDATLSQLKAMTAAQFDSWWEANVTSTQAAIAVLKRLARLVIRRVL